MEQVNMQQ